MRSMTMRLFHNCIIQLALFSTQHHVCIYFIVKRTTHYLPFCHTSIYQWAASLVLSSEQAAATGLLRVSRGECEEVLRRVSPHVRNSEER
jgi:hypothetical protein